MLDDKNTIIETFRWHCDDHNRALLIGARTLRIVRDGVAGFICPGAVSDDADGKHEIEVDTEFVPPLRLTLIDKKHVEPGSGLHPDRQPV